VDTSFASRRVTRQLEKIVAERGLPEVIRCYGTQFTSSRFIETLNRLGITHRRTAHHHPEGNSYIERFHRSLEEARTSIGRWIEGYNHDRPHRGVGNRTPHEAFLAFAFDLNSEALNV